MKIELWTDGSSTGASDGPGGWAFILRALDDNGELLREIERSGAAPRTTNNRMELQAAIEGLDALTRASTVTIYSDSQYLTKAFTEERIYRWIANGWALNRSGSRPLPNVDQWMVLKMHADRHDITWEHVRGHVGVLLNERCDLLAVEARKSQHVDVAISL